MLVNILKWTAGGLVTLAGGVIVGHVVGTKRGCERADVSESDYSKMESKIENLRKTDSLFGVQEAVSSTVSYVKTVRAISGDKNWKDPVSIRKVLTIRLTANNIANVEALADALTTSIMGDLS